MELVVVLGAGATLAEAQSHRAHTREHPPLDTNFFSKAIQIKSPHVAAMRRAAQQAGLTDPFSNPEPRMEDFFGDVYYDVQDTSNSSALEAYRTLLRLYAQTLAFTTRWFYAQPRGALGRWVRKLIRVPDLTRLTFVSFNHDLVLENVLVQLPRVRRWCVDRGYGPVALTPVKSRANIPPLPRHDPAVCDHSVEVALLKLHGSLNWQVETRAHNPAYANLFPSSARVQTMECIIDRVPSVTLQRARKRRTYKLWPQIVPPIYGKQQLISNRFGSLWTEAGNRLRTAQRIIFVGYSMPAADVHTQKMISRCVSANSSAPMVQVINPDRLTAARFAEVTNARRISWYRDLADY